MFLTRLKLDLRCASVRRDLASAYEMHRTLCRAFTDSDEVPPSRFLWRLENAGDTDGVAVLLVQSDEAGRWGRLPSDGYALDVESKAIDLDVLLKDDQRCRFRVLANPTVTRQGKRYGLAAEEEQLAWLERQLQKAGCVIQGVCRTRSERWSMKKKGNVITVQAVGFEGVLAVDQASLLRVAVRQGIGHAKSLGLGMLSVAPI